MKKLRPTEEEKQKLLLMISNKLSFHNKGSIEAFSIEDLKTEFKALPKNIKKPTLYIKAEAYMKMLELVNQSPVECSWHGLVKRDREQNKYLIYDILVFPQINSATSTTTDEDAFAEWQTNLIMDINFPIEDLRMHGHSHVNMNVFSSGIDDQYQEDLLTKVDDGDYYIFLIMNKKMEICIFLYDFTQQIMFEKNDINFEIIGDNEYIRSWADEQLKEKAKTAAPIRKKAKSFYDDWYKDEDYTVAGTCVTPIFRGRR